MIQRNISARRRTLFLVQLPGAIHGSSIIGKNLMDHCAKSGDVVINISLAKGNESINKFGFSKVFTVLRHFVEIFMNRNMIDQFVLLYTANGLLIYRDLVFTYLLRSKRKILLMNNRVVSEPGFIKRQALKSLFRNSMYVVNSEMLLVDYYRVLQNPNYFIIPNSDFSDEDSVAVQKEFSELKILYLSNLQRSKGVLRSLYIVKKIKDLGYKVSLKIAGIPIDVTMNEINSKISELGINDIVKVIGPVYGPAKIKLYQAANIFMLPTDYPLECFPVSIVEALRYGNLVISARTGGIPSMIKDSVSGYLFDLDNLDEGINRFIRGENEWTSIAANGRNYYESNLTLDIWINAWKKLLNG